MQHDARTVVVSNSSETMDVLASVLRFSKSLSARKGVLTLFLLIASVIGGVYYVTAERVYQSEGELMIMKSGANASDANNGGAEVVTEDMPTFEKMMKGDEVIQATIKSLPPEHYHDFAGVRASNWERVFRSRLSVSTARDTNIMSVNYRSGSPETAKIVVDSLLTQYISYVEHIFKRDAGERLQLFYDQRDDVQLQIDETIKRHAALLRNSNLIIDEGEKITNLHAEAVRKLNFDLMEAVTRRSQAHEFHLKLENAIADGEDLTNYLMQMSDSIGTDLLQKQLGMDTGSGSVAVRQWEEIVNAEAELQDKLDRLGPNHPKVRELRTQITMKQQRLRELPENARQAASDVMETGLGPQLLALAKRRHDLAINHEKNVQANLEQASQKASDLNGQLALINNEKSKLDQLRNSLDRLNNNIATVALDEQRQLLTQITSPPQLESAPVSPKLSLVVVMSLFLGFAAACATIYVMDLLDDRFHTPDDLRSELGVPILAMVQRLNPLGDHGIRTLHTYSRPNSPESEAFRTLRTALDFSSGGSRRLTISSTEPGDGKTTILSNLAVAFAQSGKRTLVIDGDMRRPGLTRLFRSNGKSGLSTILRETRPILDSVIGAIQQTEMDNLHILPAGPRPVNPVELLTNDRLSELLAWAETSYDQILIDAPPSLAVTDAAIIGRLVDGAILTVRPDRNRRKLVLRASEALTSLGCQLIGVVINSTQASGSTEYGYAYGHGEYGHDDPVGSDFDHDDVYGGHATPQMSGSSLGRSRDRSNSRIRRRRAA